MCYFLRKTYELDILNKVIKEIQNVISFTINYTIVNVVEFILAYVYLTQINIQFMSRLIT